VVTARSDSLLSPSARAAFAPTDTAAPAATSFIAARLLTSATGVSPP
jgi:hypothetical protein